jgi:hypothetical protein
VHSLGQWASGERETSSATSVDDAALVAAVLRKDRKATAEFVARFADNVYAYVRALLAPRQDQIEDLVQEVFLSARCFNSLKDRALVISDEWLG